MALQSVSLIVYEPPELGYENPEDFGEESGHLNGDGFLADWFEVFFGTPVMNNGRKTTQISVTVTLVFAIIPLWVIPQSI